MKILLGSLLVAVTMAMGGCAIVPAPGIARGPQYGPQYGYGNNGNYGGYSGGYPAYGAGYGGAMVVAPPMPVVTAPVLIAPRLGFGFGWGGHRGRRH